MTRPWSTLARTLAPTARPGSRAHEVERRRLLWLAPLSELLPGVDTTPDVVPVPVPVPVPATPTRDSRGRFTRRS